MQDLLTYLLTYLITYLSEVVWWCRIFIRQFRFKYTGCSNKKTIH